MATVTRPVYVNVWASEGDVSVPSFEKTAIGWIQEFPPHTIANYIEKRQDTAIKYIFQEGIPEWSSVHDYRTGSYVKVDSVTYISISDDNINKNPTTESGFWSIAFDTYGSAAAVGDIVSQITDTDGYLTHYLRKSNPILTVTMKAPNYQASTGLSNGYKFAGSVANSNSGMVLNSGNLEFALSGSVKARITPTMDVNTNDETLVTTQMLKSFMLDYCYPVGSLHITEEAYNPADKFGGSWLQVAMGQAIVGRHTSSSGTIPDWVKTAGSTFGEYGHTLTVDEIPEHSHAQKIEFGGNNPFASSGQLGDELCGETVDSAQYVNPLSLPLHTALSGGNQAHNNVQPSIVYNIWKRTG